MTTETQRVRAQCEENIESEHGAMTMRGFQNIYAGSLPPRSAMATQSVMFADVAINRFFKETSDGHWCLKKSEVKATRFAINDISDATYQPTDVVFVGTSHD